MQIIRGDRKKLVGHCALLCSLWCAAAATSAGFDPDFPYVDHILSVQAKDGIPALTNPDFADPEDITYLADEDIVIGVVIDGVARAYPHNIGWRHEVINDAIGSEFISATFCPLTGTSLVFDAKAEDGTQLQLGVSGLLINSNLVMYDKRDDQSLYPQMLFTGISGSFQGRQLELLPTIETTWKTWRTLFPATQAPVPQTGWDAFGGGRLPYPERFYISYPYFSSSIGDYRSENDWLLFLPTTSGDTIDDTLPSKDIVLGLCADEQSKAYPFNTMSQNGAVINDQVGSLPVVVVYDAVARLAMPFDRRVDGRLLEFYPVEGGAFTEFVDVETGTRWNILGQAVEGPLVATQLRQIAAYNSMWFAWAAYWPDTAVWAGEGLIDSPTAVAVGDGARPWDLALGQNYPNPFNASTLISYQLPAAATVSLAVYNSAGQLVRRLVAGHQQAGVYVERWDGRAEDGVDAGSGIYFYRLKIGVEGRELTRSMSMIR